MASNQGGIRLIRVSSSLGTDVFKFRSLAGIEELGRLFKYSLHLLSEQTEIKFNDVLGQDMTVEFEAEDGSTRHFHGFVSEFCHDGDEGRFASYRVVLHPWLWFLTQTADCRIFQQKTVPEIVKKVLQDQGFTDVEDSLSRTYPKWDYCVQYRETDFNFVSRLLEQEGIYYYFKHSDGKHTLVLADTYAAHDVVKGYEQIRYLADPQMMQHKDGITNWSVQRSVKSSAYVLSDFEFTKPKAKLAVQDSISRSHANSNFEVFDYPGEYDTIGDGKQYVRTRIEELQAQHERCRGSGNVRGLRIGSLFELVDFPRKDQNREYLVVAASYRLVDGSHESGTGSEPIQFAVDFECMDSHEQFRSARVTPKPIVQGPQTAVVVGKQGEEIWTDEYGRVKVQFHWDREGAANEDSSCWIRVAQVWAGKKWGGMYVPRIGQEVIVEFLEGDPDQPIVTGRVYNGENMPPYDLPAEQTVSTLKSNSSKGGDGFNEIKFEDKKGEEKIYIHAQKNQDILIGNNRHLTVGGQEVVKIKKTMAYTVDEDVSEDFKANHSLKVAKDQTVNATNILLEATAKITLKVGGSTVTVEPGSVKIESPMVEVNGSAVTTIKGGMVKIN